MTANERELLLAVASKMLHADSDCSCSLRKGGGWKSETEVDRCDRCKFLELITNVEKGFLAMTTEPAVPIRELRALREKMWDAMEESECPQSMSRCATDLAALCAKFGE